MARQRTLGGLVKSVGLALTIVKIDKYWQERKAKKLEKLSKDVEDDKEVSIIVIEVEA